MRQQDDGNEYMIFGWALLALVAALSVSYFPDFRRYMHIKRM